jgi:mRNA interferase RelE/StbE
VNLIVSPLFKEKISSFSAEIKNLIRKKLDLFVDNPKHPSLQSKKIQGTEYIFESRINHSIRFTWQYMGESIVLRNIGPHDPTLKNPVPR